MKRTQISLTEQERLALDTEATRTGRSLSALIRDAVEQVYGAERSVDEDLAAMQAAFGSWEERELHSDALVEQLRSGARLPQSS